MNIGVLKERKRDEHRVALRPKQAAKLVAMGHQVYVEHGSGLAAGFEDQAYVGSILSDREEIYEKCSLLLKIKCPLPEEYRFLGPKNTLFAYMHFDENIPPENIRAIERTEVTVIAYEWVEENGTYPLLQPMSELSGVVFARKAMSLLMEHAGLLGGKYFDAVLPARAMVIGLGHIGANAVHVFARNGLNLTIVDKHPESIDARINRYVAADLWAQAKLGLAVIRFDEENPEESVARIREALPSIDILINAAVRRPTLPKSRCEFIVDRAGVASMRRNSVVCDATACDREFVETAVSSESLTEYYVEEGVIHYNCDHIPSLVASTATQMLASATFPYVLQLLNGFEQAVSNSPALANGVMCYRGHLTHAYSAEKKGLPYTPLENLL